jgi:hypothetical protein
VPNLRYITIRDQDYPDPKPNEKPEYDHAKARTFRARIEGLPSTITMQQKRTILAEFDRLVELKVDPVQAHRIALGVVFGHSTKSMLK